MGLEKLQKNLQALVLKLIRYDRGKCYIIGGDNERGRRCIGCPYNSVWRNIDEQWWNHFGKLKVAGYWNLWEVRVYLGEFLEKTTCEKCNLWELQVQIGVERVNLEKCNLWDYRRMPKGIKLG